MFSLLAAPAAATAAAAALAVIHMVLAQLAVGGGHKLLQLILKGHRLGTLSGAGKAHGTSAAGAASSLAGRSARRTGRGILGLLDGQVHPAALIHTDELDLHSLPLLQMVLHVNDVSVGDLRNM